MRAWLAALTIAVMLPALPSMAAAQDPGVTIPRMRVAPADAVATEKGPRRVIRFLTSTDFPPFQFMKADGTPAGFNVDLARAICAKLQFPCTIQAWPWDDLMGALDTGRADALIAGLKPSEELRRKVDLTRPYFRLPARFVMKREQALADANPETLAGKKIAVVQGSAHEAYLKDFFPGAELVSLPDADQARSALREGRADALFGDGSALALWLGGTASENCCTFFGGPFTESRFFGEGLSIAMKKGDVRLRQELDRTLDEIESDGTLADLYLRWFPLGIF